MANDETLGILIKTTSDLTGLNQTKQAVTGLSGAVQSGVSGINNLGNQLKSLAPVSLAAGGALAGMAALAKSSISGFKEEQLGIAKLTQLILNQKGATQENVEALKSQAKALSNVTTYTDDAIISAQAQLATFDLSTEAIEKIIPGFLDMVAAEKGASISAEEMKAQAQGLGKALVGQTDTLVKQGFQFTELQKEILKTGNEQERLTVISEVMGRTYGGMAAKLLEVEGSSGQLSKELGELKDTLGGALAPVVEQVTAALLPVVKTVADWIEKNPELTKQIVLITAGVLAFFAALAPIGFAITGVGLAIAALASPIGIIVIALAALAVAFILNYDKIKKGFIDPLISGLHVVNDAITGVLQKIGLLGEGKTFAGQAGEGIKFLGENLLNFDQGGVVPGPVGAPQLAVVHGGETVLPNNQPANTTQNVTINIEVRENVDLQQVAQLMDQYLGQKSISRQFGIS